MTAVGQARSEPNVDTATRPFEAPEGPLGPRTVQTRREGAGRCSVASNPPLPVDGGGGSEAQKQGYVPQIGLQLPAPLTDFIFFLRSSCLTGGGEGGFARPPNDLQGEGGDEGGTPPHTRGKVLWPVLCEGSLAPWLAVRSPGPPCAAGARPVPRAGLRHAIGLRCVGAEGAPAAAGAWAVQRPWAVRCRARGSLRTAFLRQKGVCVLVHA